MCVTLKLFINLMLTVAIGYIKYAFTFPQFYIAETGVSCHTVYCTFNTQCVTFLVIVQEKLSCLNTKSIVEHVTFYGAS